MFSIILPLYNKEKSIYKTIKSVLNQTYNNYELIIINDGSTDNSVNIVNGFSDKRIKLINKENGGVSSARNLGITESKYEFIAFIDGDDLWNSNYLFEMNSIINKYTEYYAFASAWARQKNDQIIYENFHLSNDKVHVISNYFEIAINHTLLWTSAVIIKKDIFTDIGYFDTNLSMGEDIDFWIRLNLKYKFIFYNVVLAFYIQDSENRACQGKIKPLHNNLLFKIDNYRNKLNNEYLSVFIDKYILRQIVPYFFNKETKNEALSIISGINISLYSRFWNLIYMKYGWTIKYLIYNIYKIIR